MWRATLPSGLTLVHEERPCAGSVALGVWVAVGSRDEDGPDGFSGRSHLLEHLLFAGTSTRSSQQLVGPIERAGGTVNAFTTQEETCFWAFGLASEADLMLETLADMVCDPVFSTEDLARERRVVAAEMLAASGDVEAAALAAALAALHPAHPVTMPVLGRPELLEAVRHEELVAHHRSFYTPERMVVSCSGPMPFGWLVEACGRLFPQGPSSASSSGESLLPGLRRPVAGGAAPEGETSLSRLVLADAPQTTVAVALPAAPLGDPLAPTIAVISELLGGGMSSLLFRQVRELASLVYSVRAQPLLFSDVGVLVLCADAPSGVADEVAGLMLAALDGLPDLVDSDPDLVAAAVSRLSAARRLSEESSADRMRAAGARAVAGLEPLTLDAALGRFAAVSSDHASRFAEDLVSSPRAVVLAGPPSSGADVV